MEKIIIRIAFGGAVLNTLICLAWLVRILTVMN